MNRFIAASAGLLSCLAVSASTAERGIESITSSEFVSHVRYLASDQMRGRGNGTPELDRAASYIAWQLTNDHAKPAFGKSYFQTFEITTRTDFAPESKVIIRSGETTQELSLFSGFLPLGLGDESTSIDGDLVFAGYGIATESPAYDDYKDVDVKDKIIVIMTHSPREKEEVRSGEDQLALQSTLTSKAMNARMHGAKGMIIIADPLHRDDERDALPPFKEGGSAEEWGIPVVAVHLPAIEPLLKSAGKDLGALHEAIDHELKPQSFALTGARAEIHLTATRTKKPVKNVAAAIPGKTDEWIVIGAHYDHLGLGEKNSLAPRLIGIPHHGADDNASGVAGLLELAKAFSSEKPNRSILFVAFAGEELGLLGSSYFAKNPPVPTEKIVTMINMDMIGRPKKDRIFVSGVGTSPAFTGIIEKDSQAAGLQAALSKSGYSASDQISFVSKGIPALFFFSGLHSDYHKPSDTWDKIDGPAAQKVVRMIYRVAEDVAALPERPAFVRVEEPVPPAGRTGGGGLGAYFGSIPDFGEEVKGVKFADIKDGSPAAKAGLKAGDILIKFDGQEIKNLYDFSFALKSHKPGQIVDVVVLRDSQELSVKVTLENRQ